MLFSGFPWWLNNKESACNAIEVGSIPGLGRSPAEEHGNPLLNSCLENFMDRGTWWVTVHRTAKSQIQLKQLSTHTCMEQRWASLLAQSSACQYRRPGFDPRVGKMPWRRKWQPAPVFLPGESHGQRSLLGYSPQHRKESNRTEWMSIRICSLIQFHDILPAPLSWPFTILTAKPPSKILFELWKLWN